MTLLLIPALLYAFICAFMWAKQRSLMYYPLPGLEAPEAYGLEGFQEISLQTADGLSLRAWRHEAAEGRPTIVFFHGNGGHLGYRAPLFAALAEAGYGVLAPEYRGYGGNPGLPTESGLLADGRAALGYAARALALPPERIVLFGESLGTGVAVRLASETKIGALILQSPFTSTVDRAAELYPWIPVRLLMKDRFESLAAAPAVTAPVLVLHGARDDVVPLAHGQALYAAFNTPKHIEIYPAIGHNDFPVETIMKPIEAFLTAQRL